MDLALKLEESDGDENGVIVDIERTLNKMHSKTDASHEETIAQLNAQEARLTNEIDKMVQMYKNVHAEVEQFGSVTAAAQKKLETFTESVKHINEVITMSSICSDVDLAGPTDTSEDSENDISINELEVELAQLQTELTVMRSKKERVAKLEIELKILQDIGEFRNTTIKREN